MRSFARVQGLPWGLIPFIACILSSAGSLLLAVFFPEIETFDIALRVLWYAGFGIFLVSAVLVSMRLPFQYRKSKECKAELLRAETEGMDPS